MPTIPTSIVPPLPSTYVVTIPQPICMPPPIVYVVPVHSTS